MIVAELLNENKDKLSLSKSGVLMSMNQKYPQTMFGFTYFGHMIPPFKPLETLILGYGENGTVAELMRKVWGCDLKIIGVDVLTPEPGTFMEYKNIILDARDYVGSCCRGSIKTMFEYIVVDVFDELGNVPDFVFENDFAGKLSSICKKLTCFNVRKSDASRMSVYQDQGRMMYERADVVGDQIVTFYSKKQ